MIPKCCIEVQTSPTACPSVPAWFAEVVVITQHLATMGILDAIAQQVSLVRGRFGQYEPIDFLALLLGYAVSGERTLAAFFERLAPFGSAFMALFGRAALPHRATLSRFLAGVDAAFVEAFRALFEQHSFVQQWTTDSIGGMWGRQGCHSIVFDVDATDLAPVWWFSIISWATGCGIIRREPSSPPFSTFEEKSLSSCSPFYSQTFLVSVWSR